MFAALGPLRQLGSLRPGPVLFVLLLAWIVLGALAVWQHGLRPAWHGMGLAAALLLVIEALRLLQEELPEIVRKTEGSLPLGVWRDIRLRATNHNGRSLRLTLFDDYPTAAAEIEGLPLQLEVAPGHWAEALYRLRATVRGEHMFSGVEALLESPFRLWRRHVRLGEPQSVRVYPNFAAVAKFALLATDNRLSQMGIRKRRRRGEGMEFHQLREYRDGDSLRQIDWNATSRQLKLISREYQDERDQQVVFLVDCGRRMLACDDDLPHFDQALNAVLLLSYVALRQGDAVGLLTFSGDTRFIPPVKGAHAVNVVLSQVYDLQPSLMTPDYRQAATELLKRLKKRSLIVLVTNLRDEDAGELIPALRMLRTRHLVLLASLQERIINQALETPVDTFDDALRHAATHRYLAGRRKATDTVRGHGVELLDVEPSQLPISLVNRYLDIKRSGKL